MKRLALLVAVMTCLAGGLQAQDAARLLRTAMNTETIDGDLAGAIKQYQAIVAKYAQTDRAVAAEALLRMADAYQKLGDTQARAVYERIVRDYADQKESVAAARASLARAEADRNAVDISANWPPDGRPPFSIALSHDGRYSTFIDSAGELAVRDMQIGRIRELTSLVRAGGFIDTSAISRDNQYVAFASHERDRARPGVRILPLGATPATMPRLLNEGQWTDPQQWSADGTQLLVITDEKAQGTDVALLSVADGTLRRLPRPEGHVPEHALLSPDQRIVAVEARAKDDPRRGDIFFVPVNGGSIVAAHVTPADETRFFWSNDGRELIFVSDRAGSRGTGLWALPMADGRPTGEPRLLKGAFHGDPIGLTADGDLLYEIRVTPYEVRETTLFVAAINPIDGTVIEKPQAAGHDAKALNLAPRWSDDGRSFVYLTHRGSTYTISIRTTDTGIVREVPWHLGYIWTYEVSPSGRAIVCRAIELTGKEGIFVVDLQTGSVRPIVMKDGPAAQGRGVGNYNPQFWSEDKIYFRRVSFENQQAPGQEIVRDITTGVEQVLWESPLRKFAFRSPDRKLRLAVQPAAVLVEDAATGESREVFRAPHPNAFDGADSVRWTPDSRALLAKVAGDAPNERELWWIPVDGRPAHKVALGRTDIVDTGIAIHPDGTHIAFVAGDPIVSKTAEVKTELRWLRHVLPQAGAPRR